MTMVNAPNSSLPTMAANSISLLLVVAVLVPTPGQAQVGCSIDSGFDLFETDPSTQIGPDGFPLMHFHGVPIGSYDFGSGTETLTTTDTIVQRSGATSAIPVATVDVVVLQLQGVENPDLFVTAQAQRGLNELDPPVGPPSPGALVVRFDSCGSGTFDSVINVNFDLRLGAIDGPIIGAGHFVLTTQGTHWDDDGSSSDVCLYHMNHPELASVYGRSVLARHKICGPSDIVDGVNDGDFYPGPTQDEPQDPLPGQGFRGGILQVADGRSSAVTLGAFAMLVAGLVVMRYRGQR